MAQDFSNAPKLTNMQTFKSISERWGNLSKSARFLVHIKPNGYMLNYYDFAEELIYLCEVAEIPGRAFVNVDVRYYGPNQKLPIQTQYEDMNMTFLCRNASIERKFFDDWMLVINPINTYDFNYRDDYACEIDIYQYADIGFDISGPALPAFPYSIPIPAPIAPVGPIFGGGPSANRPLIPIPTYCVTLLDSYPLLVNPQPMTWQDDMVQRLIVNFTYTKWIRKGLDPVPRIGAPEGFSFNLVEGRINRRSGSDPMFGALL